MNLSLQQGKWESVPKKHLQSLFSKSKKVIQSDLPEIIEKPNNKNCHEDAYKLIPKAIVIINSSLKILYLNPYAEKFIGSKLRSVMGRNYDSVFLLLGANTKRPLQNFLNQESTEPVPRECLLQVGENKSYPIKLSAMFLRSNKNEDDHYLLVIDNIAEKKALESKLSDLETYDGLTRLLNRKSFDASVKQLIDNAHKHNAKHFLAYFSIDQFQVMNDTVGHSGGDSLIKAISEIVTANTRKGLDIVGRLGGNQFAVVFCECKIAEAIQSIKKVLIDVEKYTFKARGQSYSVTMSAGFVIVDGDSTSSTRVISESNLACNLASSRGGNNVCAYQAESAEIKKLEGNVEWVMIIKKALQENRFSMHAQPIHLLKEDEYSKPFSHYELLLRLSDEEGNAISPQEFISAAEYYSMMPTIDRWVVRNSLQQLSTIPNQSPMPVFAINLSGQSLNDSSFLSYVKEEVKSSGVNPKILCFEITEQVAVEDLNLVNDFISSMKALGSKFSLDDFGTGVSSYSYLRSLDVDYLKIDGSFVKNIASDDVSNAMVQSINQVGHTMKLKVIAEYVENKEILEKLREMGVDYGQGYHISRPGPLEAVLRRHSANASTETAIESFID